MDLIYLADGCLDTGCPNRHLMLGVLIGVVKTEDSSGCMRDIFDVPSVSLTLSQDANLQLWRNPYITQGETSFKANSITMLISSPKSCQNVIKMLSVSSEHMSEEDPTN